MIIIEDIVDEVAKVPERMDFSDDFVRNLDTVAKARQWLTNPASWRDMTTHIIYWDGIVPYISSRHGMRLVQEPWDDGIPLVVAKHQRYLKHGGKNHDNAGPESEE